MSVLRTCVQPVRFRFRVPAVVLARQVSSSDGAIDQVYTTVAKVTRSKSLFRRHLVVNRTLQSRPVECQDRSKHTTDQRSEADHA